ncbi:hypothetical protein N431DRAFT_34480 [Stipitochalara longipes BDJ]|nr:hypothetical protein N431DRAFT_34480 [Stipitochalara longipes BDJ]
MSRSSAPGKGFVSTGGIPVHGTFASCQVGSGPALAVAIYIQLEAAHPYVIFFWSLTTYPAFWNRILAKDEN